MRERYVLVNGKRHKVKLRQVNKEISFIIEVDGKPYKVEVMNKISYGSPVILKIGDKPYKVKLNKLNKNVAFNVEVDGELYTVQYESVSKATSLTITMESVKFTTKIIKKTIEKGVITTFMPGRVVSLKVKVGKRVNKGDTLCVLEAMKMENEITAPKAGIIKEVRVSEGASVNKGEVLFVIG